MDESRRWNVSNPIVDLAELTLDRSKISAQVDKETDIALDLRFGVGTIQIRSEEVEVGFRMAELYFDLDGVEMIPGNRFADHKVNTLKVNKMRQENRFSSEMYSKGGLSGKLGSISVSAESSLEKGDSNSTESTVAFDSEARQYFISSRPNGVWLLQGESDKPLVDTYLAGDVLCTLRPMPKSNRRGVKISLIVRKKNIHFALPKRQAGILSKLYSGNVNLDKVFGALVAKSIGNKPNSVEARSSIEISTIDNHEL